MPLKDAGFEDSRINLHIRGPSLLRLVASPAITHSAEPQLRRAANSSGTRPAISYPAIAGSGTAVIRRGAMNAPPCAFAKRVGMSEPMRPYKSMLPMLATPGG